MRVRSYSQHGEDLIVSKFFGIDHIGSVLDIGAGNGVKDSNSRLFVALQWEALLVEPNARNYVDLLANNRTFPKVSCLNALVGKEPGIGRFWHNDNGLATADADMQEWYANHDHRLRKEYFKFCSHVGQVSPAQIKDTFGDYEFVDIDAEGMDLEIVKNGGPIFEKAAMVCIEHVSQLVGWCKMKELLDEAMTGHGFKLYERTSGNSIYAK